MKKEFINEINHYRNLMGLEPLNESYVFKDYVVGNSSPSDDKIDPSLLKDVETASNNSDVKVVITTAVDGHDKGTRHEHGYAVDIAMVYDDKGVAQGFSSVKSAKSKGIYDKIMSFVSALESLGYKKNVGEEGNKKVVLTFGYPNHHHHIHVSNITNRGKSSGEAKKSETSAPSMEAQVRAHAKYCGWGDDVQGFMDSGKKCPKPGATTTPSPKTSTGEILKQPAGDPYEYKKTPDGKYYTKKKTSSSWINITGTKFETPIRQKVFKDL